MSLYRVRVRRVARVSPNLRRVTLAGAGLDCFPFAGPDQRVKLMLPLPGQERPELDGVQSIPEFLALPVETRPIMRTYTVRHHRPTAAEVDIDFALHGDLGPASRWATRTRPGDHVALYGPAADYAPQPDSGWQLIVGDESALPAIGSIVEHLRPSDRARVLIELADPRDQQQLRTEGEIEAEWIHRAAGVSAHRSRQLLDAVRSIEFPAEPIYVWLGGEASVVTGIRRHLVRDRGVERSRITFTGYWRHGRTENDD
ncbi:MAG TPA: siderophore-interacting protein [Mycobacteriales bacterium]|nr:siderophore-interacting protein [Mycobacteriales bacterium]